MQPNVAEILFVNFLNQMINIWNIKGLQQKDVIWICDKLFIGKISHILEEFKKPSELITWFLCAFVSKPKIIYLKMNEKLLL